jgi:hypothetical protein
MSGEDFLLFVDGLAKDIATKSAHVLRHTKRAGLVPSGQP